MNPCRPNASRTGATPSVAMLLLAWAALSPALAAAQAVPTERQPTVSVSSSASNPLPNDRMFAVLRVEKEDASASAASADVNTRMARVLARLKAQPAFTVQPAGYSTDLVSEKDKPRRWRVAQALRVESADFALLANELGTQQADNVLLAGLGYTLSDEARRKAEDALTAQAIREWQERASRAAQALGYAGWRVGSVAVQTSEPPRPYVMMRAAAPMMAAAAPVPVAGDGGTTEVTVSVSGDAVLEQRR